MLPMDPMLPTPFLHYLGTTSDKSGILHRGPAPVVWRWYANYVTDNFTWEIYSYVVLPQ